MNRKLQHTFQALAASAAVFSLMLIAGGPTPMPGPIPAPATATLPATLLVVSVEAAEAADVAAATEAPAAGEREARPARRHRRGHATTALPYFSFAQGLRQVAGS
jgi:hypothetical protein